MEVQELLDEDIPECCEIISKSFGHNEEFVDIYFPKHDMPSGQASLVKRLTEWKHSTPESKFLKSVTTYDRTGRKFITGVAIWTLMKEPPPVELEKAENVEEVWPDEEDREYMSRLWKTYVIPRSRAIHASEGKGVYVLELLAVHPNAQRAGAGTALVKWGTQAADEQGVKSVVESTKLARRCYEKAGMQIEIEEFILDAGEKFSGKRKSSLIFLTRDPVARDK